MGPAHGRTSEAQLAAVLVREFEVDPATAQADVTEIIDDLCAEGLARRLPVAGGDDV